MYLIMRSILLDNKEREFYLHCAGHSLGAHACAFLGKHLVADPETKQLDRLSGLFSSCITS